MKEIIRALREYQPPNLEELVDFSFSIGNGIIRPIQIKEEILELLKILQKRKSASILEIGTLNGGTLFLFTRVAREDALIISIDLPNGPFGGGYSPDRIPLYKSFALEQQQLYLIRGNSHEQSTLMKVKEILNDNQLDFLFIDGDHTYEGVKKDFEMYSPLVREGGLIALHDIVYHPHAPQCRVSDFWHEIRRKYKTKEIISSPDQTWAGIGLVFL